MSEKKMWDGRFSKVTDEAVHRFNRSIDFDFRLYRQDICGSQAHARMLEKIGLLSAEEAQQIIEGLSAIAADIDQGRLTFDPASEDIHMFVESELTRRIGETGKKLHTGRSRNDQVALDLRLYLRDHTSEISALIRQLVQVLLDLASRHCETVLPGYTHLQRAQPVTLAHHLMAYVQMFLRDLGRLRDASARMDESPLGAAALAGSSFPLDREMVARELGFSRVCVNSMDAVSDRDFAVELTSAFALFMVHLSRLSEELILWSSQEFSFIEIDDAFATGSSLMPQKKNPDVAELARGKAARVIGGLTSLLTLMKGLPLAYNKDMQEDKEIIFSAVDTLELTLPPYIGMLQSLTVHTDVMREAARGGFTDATDVADYLAARGLPFREAHQVVGKLVACCLSKGCRLGELPLETYQQFSTLFGDDLYQAISLETSIKKRALTGGPALQTEREAIAAAQKTLDTFRGL